MLSATAPAYIASLRTLTASHDYILDFDAIALFVTLKEIYGCLILLNPTLNDTQPSHRYNPLDFKR